MTPVPPMTDSAARLLVTSAAVAGPGDGDPVAALFTTSFGFRQRPILDLGHRAATLYGQLRDLAGECSVDDTVVVAIAARGFAVEGDLLLLPETSDDQPPNDSAPDEPVGERPGVRMGELVESLLADTRVRRLAILLDVRCDPETVAVARRAVPGWLRRIFGL